VLTKQKEISSHQKKKFVDLKNVYASYTILKVVLLCRVGQQLVFFLFKFLQNFYVKTLRTCVCLYQVLESSTWRAPLRAQVTRWEQMSKVSLVSKLVFFLTVSSQFATTTRTTRVCPHFASSLWAEVMKKSGSKCDNQGRYSDKLKICRQITFNLKYAGKKILFRERATKCPRAIPALGHITSGINY